MKTPAFPIVRYTNPQPGEEVFRFHQISDPDALGCVQLQLICDDFIKPVERVHVSEVTLCAS